MLFALFLVVLFGVVTKLGRQTNAKLCLATAERIHPDRNGDGQLSGEELGSIVVADSSNDLRYDYDCDSLVEASRSGNGNLAGGNGADDIRIAKEWMGEP